MLFSSCLFHLFQLLPGNFSIFKYIGCNDHMARPCFQIFLGIPRIHTSTDLQSSRIGAKRQQCLLLRCLIIRRILTVQQDYMTANNPSLFIQFCIKGSILLRHEVLLRLILYICQAAADDLFYFSIMYINAWAKSHMFKPPYSVFYFVTLILLPAPLDINNF